MRAVRRALRPFAGALLVLATGAGCNLVDAIRAEPVEIVKMVPGGNVATGGLDCWLTLTFDHYPEGADPTDLVVRFRSVALREPAEFDWAYIASRDVLAAGGAFGRGHRPATATTPDRPPPLGEPIKVRFPLDARRRVDDASGALWLEAEVVWGGRRVVGDRRTIEHVYSRAADGLF